MKDSTGNLYLDQKPGRTAVVNGQELLFFSGYNYLGINDDAEFIDLVLEGTGRYGWLYPSSRISNTRLAVYEECEALLSTLTGSADTVLLPSGFTAGRVAIAGYPNLINAPASHPAIPQKRSDQVNFDQWRIWLLQQTAEPLTIASDSVNPLLPAINDFSFLQQMQVPLTAVIDDSHGVGIIGKDGSGVSSLMPQGDGLNFVFTYSLSKAFGVAGGAVSCSKQQAVILRSMPEYSAVTPMSPAQVYAFNKGQHIYLRQHKKLMENIVYFESCVKDLPNIKHQSGLPVFTLPGYINEQFLLNNGILISSFAYPDPSGQLLKRIVLSALHTKADLDNLTLILKSAYAASSL